MPEKSDPLGTMHYAQTVKPLTGNQTSNQADFLIKYLIIVKGKTEDFCCKILALI